MRRYDVLYLDAMGQIEEMHRMAPAVPVFEAAFGAFSHGTLIDSADGPVAVEDLVPGMLVQTRAKGLEPIVWIGSMTLAPIATAAAFGARLIRLTDGRFGDGRPRRDLVLGPHARVLRRSPGCLPLFGTDSAFAPVAALVDGVSIIELTPASPVRVFHIGLRGQQILYSSGVEVESYHPGRREAWGVSASLQPIFMSLFPHMDSYSGFGHMTVPRLSEEDARQIEGM
ncbi:MAG: Hint domain-containing protein [Pseudomonadota bacterium]